MTVRERAYCYRVLHGCGDPESMGIEKIYSVRDSRAIQGVVLQIPVATVLITLDKQTTNRDIICILTSIVIPRKHS